MAGTGFGDDAALHDVGALTHVKRIRHILLDQQDGQFFALTSERMASGVLCVPKT
jgi:hypothetical protein